MTCRRCLARLHDVSAAVRNRAARMCLLFCTVEVQFKRFGGAETACTDIEGRLRSLVCLLFVRNGD